MQEPNRKEAAFINYRINVWDSETIGRKEWCQTIFLLFSSFFTFLIKKIGVLLTIPRECSNGKFALKRLWFCKHRLNYTNIFYENLHVLVINQCFGTWLAFSKRLYLNLWLKKTNNLMKKHFFTQTKIVFFRKTFFSLRHDFLIMCNVLNS